MKFMKQNFTQNTFAGIFCSHSLLFISFFLYLNGCNETKLLMTVIVCTNACLCYLCFFFIQLPVYLPPPCSAVTLAVTIVIVVGHNAPHCHEQTSKHPVKRTSSEYKNNVIANQKTTHVMWIR